MIWGGVGITINGTKVNNKCNGLVVLQSLSHVQLFGTHGLQHARLPGPSLYSGVHANSYSLSRWCHQSILSSIAPFSSCLQSFLASKSFLMNQPFTSGGQSTKASASVLPISIWGWFPLGFGLISLQSKGLSRVISNTTVQKLQFFNAQLSLWSNYYIHT